MSSAHDSDPIGYGAWRRVLVMLALLLAAAGPLSAQKENDVWYFGRFAGIDFNGPVPVPLTDGELNSFEGTASISDPATGRLLFYTDGITVWNREHRPMPNGTGLNGDSSTTQSAVIVPSPGDPDLYYLFTAGAYDRDGYLNNGYNYSVVRMSLDGGLGDVERKNIQLLKPGTEKLTAVRHCNGRDFWVIGHAWVSDSFYVYRVTDTGVVETPVISRSGPFLYTRPIGYLQGSPDGHWLANAIVGIGQPLVLHRFDNATGIVGQYFPLPMEGESLYGTCFSPDNSKIYVTDALSHSLYQFDISSPVYADIRASKELIHHDDVFRYGAIQRAPDGKLYVARAGAVPATGDSLLGVITRPNLRAEACGFVPRGFSLNGRRADMGLPNIAHVYVPLDAGRDTTICPGDSVRLSGSGPAGIRWTPADGLSCTGCPNPMARPTKTTTYILLGSGEGGCRDARDTVIVTVDAPRVDAGRDTVICEGARIRLAGSGDGELHWSPEDAVSCTSCPDPEVSPAATTTYYLRATSAGGCTSIDSVRVGVFDAASIRLSPDTSICAGSPAHLRVEGTGVFSWSPSATLSCADCADPIATPEVTTTYTVTATGAGGCSAVRSMTVTVRPAPTVGAGSDTTICSGGSVTLRATGAGPFLWSPPDGLSCLDCASPVASPAATTTYRVESSTDGCTGFDLVTVTVLPSPAPDAGRDTTICEGDSVTLVASGGETYRWTPSDGLSCDDCPRPTARPARTMVYRLTATNGGRCSLEDAVTVTVLPKPAVAAGKDTTICAGGSARLSASGAASFRWSPADGLDCADCPSPTARPGRTTDYVLEGWNAGGCIGRDTVRVVVGASAALTARIPRDGAIAPGSEGTVPVMLDGLAGAGEIDTIEVEIDYSPDIFRFDGISQEGGLLEGWRVEEKTGERGRIAATFIREGGRSLGRSGLLFNLRFSAYIGRTTGSELPFRLSIRPGVCVEATASAGYLRVDSICGLGLRLIELYAGKYALDGIVPNPFNPSTEIRFSLAMDGPTRLVVEDATRRVVAVLVDGMLDPGSYSVRWDASSFPSGVYYCRLTSGAWGAAARMVLVK